MALFIVQIVSFVGIVTVCSSEIATRENAAD